MFKLTFDSQDALLLFATKILDTPLMSSPVRVLEQEEIIHVFTDEDLPKKTLTKLGIDIQTVKDIPKESKKLACLAEAIKTKRVSVKDYPIVLFVPKNKDVKAADLASELLRLGCDQQEVCFLAANPGFMIKAVRPPYYTVAKTMDRSSNLAAFVPTQNGQEQVWIENEYAHPLETTLKTKDNKLLLVSASGKFAFLPDGPWTKLYAWLDITPPETKTITTVKEKEKLNVTLNLVSYINNKVPNLWVLNDFSILDTLVQTLPEQEIDKWLFSVVTINEEKKIILCPTRAQKTIPILNVEGSPYLAYKAIDNLYLPKDTALNPPLSVETLKELFIKDQDKLTIIDKRDNGVSTKEIELSSFVPLKRWITYVFDSNSANISHWVQSVFLEVDPYVSIGCEWKDGEKPKEKKRVEEHKEEKKTQEESIVIQKEEKENTKRGRGRPKKVVVETPAVQDTSTEKDKRIKALEEQYVSSDLSVDHPERLEILENLGEEYADRNAKDANLCLVRSVWENPEKIESLVKITKGVDTEFKKIIKKSGNTFEDLQAVITKLQTCKEIDQKTLYDIKLWLLDQDDMLDVRSLWLAYTAISNLVGGDKLLLAKVRDRILDRLINGLSIEKDIPTFMRFSSKNNVQDVTKIQRELDTLYTFYKGTKRTRSSIEADTKLTDAYVQLLFAYGYAHLGDMTKSGAEQEAALKIISTSDSLHNYVTSAFCEKIKQASVGDRLDQPLSTENRALLEKLDKFDRYKADRLRQVSLILEYNENIDPVTDFQTKNDPIADIFSALYLRTKVEDKVEGITAVIDAIKNDQYKNKYKALDKTLDYIPTLGENNFMLLIKRVLPLIDTVSDVTQVQLMVKALTICGFFSKRDLVELLVGKLTTKINNTTIGNAKHLAKALNQCLGSLRRVGLITEALQLIKSVADISLDDTNITSVLVRTQLVSSLADLGRIEDAKQIIAIGEKILASKEILMSERLELTKAFALALGSFPEDYAIDKMKALYKTLEDITDSYNTNSHFCLSVLNFMESLILGYVNDKLSMSDLGKKWMADDEYLVRRRINSDFEAL